MSKEEPPQWAVERADDLCAQILERATDTDYGIGVSLDARDLIARALGEAAPQWRTDMEDAPRDGTCILIYAEGVQFVAFWAVSIEEGDGQWVIARSPGMAFIVRDPTHWMPLPDAPEVEND